MVLNWSTGALTLACCLPPQVVRRSGRIPKEIPILLIGSDLDGRLFSEPTKTVVLSLHGAGLVSKHKLCPEQELVLRWPERNKEAEIRIVGNLGTHRGVHTYGVAFLQPYLNFWETEFPPVSPAESEMGLLRLACSACKTVEKVDDSGMEADMCTTNEGVIRFCKCCGSSTLWRPVADDASQKSASPAAEANPQMSLFQSASPSTPRPSPAPPEPRASDLAASPSSESASAPNSANSRPLAHAAHTERLEDSRTAVLTMTPPEKPAPAPVNRRKHSRVKVNYSGCVRHPAHGEEIVLCEDMSKGGLRFKSRRMYHPQSLIEVAAPYQPGQAAIFVPAQIVFVQELPEQQLFRHGVQYLKAIKHRDSY